MEFIADRIAEDAEANVRPIAEVIDEHRREQAAANQLRTELTKALDALERVDALVSTATRSIASGDASDSDLQIVLGEYAWPQIEATRQAIEAALQFTNGEAP